MTIRAGSETNLIVADFPEEALGQVGVTITNAATSVEFLPRTTTGILDLGGGSYSKTITAPTVEGEYLVRWDAGVDYEAVETLDVESVTAPQVGPGVVAARVCSLWADPAELRARRAELSDQQSENALLAASELLYEWSGRQFVGRCETSVRPCCSGCSCWQQVLSRGHVIGGACSSGCCGTEQRLRLYGDVRSVVSITIDGAELDPAAYEHDARWVYRVDGWAWPRCQNMRAACGDPGSFCVTYEYGIDPPSSGVEAALDLALLIASELGPDDDCALPTNVTSINREGVSFSLDPAAAMSAASSVGTFLKTYNPGKVTRRPAVWSPDVCYPRRIA